MYYFDEYVMGYDINDIDINYKYHHSYRVMDNMINLAKGLGLNKYDLYLAKVIGVLHDIGRFEQDKLYNSFIDNKMDHGSYGVLYLKRSNLLDKFNISKDDYNVVYKAIFNHNKFSIEDGLNERELFFSRMIRDADKIDILYALSNPNLKKELRQDDNDISSLVKVSFFNNKSINKSDVISKNDSLILIFGFIFDFNFKVSFNIIYDKDYYNKIYNRIIRKDIFDEYINYVNNYIEKNISNNILE